MRKAMWLAATVTVLALASAAYGAVSNDYTLTGHVLPTKSGTESRPSPTDLGVSWTVVTSPPGQRPVGVRAYDVSIAGVQENTTSFPACGTSTLDKHGVKGCPKGSEIGDGYIVSEIGPSGNSDDNYNTECRDELRVFNGGNHDLSLYVFSDGKRHDGLGECPVPRRHYSFFVRLNHSTNGLGAHFGVPVAQLHPSKGVSAAVIKAKIDLAQVSKPVSRHERSTRRLGLFETYTCPPNHQRQIGITFTREDGVRSTSTVLTRCN